MLDMKTYQEMLEELRPTRRITADTKVTAKVLGPAPRDHRCTNIKWGDYEIVERFTKFQRYIVCWKYDHSDHTWAQGHYFDTLQDAVTWLYNKKHEDD